MIEALLVLAAIAAAIYWLAKRDREQEPIPDEVAYQVGVAMHSIRRRFELAQLRTELLSDAAQMRRELDEMDEELQRLTGGRERS